MSKQIQLKNGDEKVFPNPFFPVGAIYMSVTSTNPSVYFGGTWERWGQGRVAVSLNEGDGDFNSSEKTGGSKTNTHNHYTLSSFDGSTFYVASANNAPRSKVVEVSNRMPMGGSYGSGGTRMDSTENESIGVVQPYITCYMWKRTS